MKEENTIMLIEYEVCQYKANMLLQVYYYYYYTCTTTTTTTTSNITTATSVLLQL